MKKTVLLLLLPFATAAFAGSAAAKSEKEEVCPRSMLNDVDRIDYDCFRSFEIDLEKEINKKYQQLFDRVAKKDRKLHGLPKSYFLEVRKKWEAYKDVLCDDPTVTTDLKTPADWYMYKCSIEQSQYHLKSLDRF